MFCRFAGCNLWSGREEQRAEAICKFCDTDFVGTDGPGGGLYQAEELAAAIGRAWRGGRGEGRPMVVLTGGEPLLQVTEELVAQLHGQGMEVAMETNGTLPAPPGIDWICVSPKAGAELRLVSGDELKLVFPQDGCGPEPFERLDFRHFFLQPMDGPQREANTRLALQYCLDHPQWRLSVQPQKWLGIR